MPFLENLVEGLAEAADNTSAVNRIETGKADRRATAREELQARSEEIFNNVRGVQDKIAALDPKDPDYKKKVGEFQGQLSEMQQTFTDLYHPAKNPGALQHLGGFLKQHLLRRPAQPPPTTPAQAKQSMAERMAQSDVYGASADPAKPVQQKYLPQTDVFTTADPETKRQQYWLIPSDPNAAPQEIKFGGQALVPKPGRPLKGYKFDAVTDEVINQDTAARYKRDDPNNPPEVAEMFKGQTTASGTKQKMAIEVAEARGQSYGEYKSFPAFDTKNANAPVQVYMKDAKASPGRYIPATAGAKAFAAENFIQDSLDISQITRGAVNNLQEDFPLDMKVKIAAAMRADDPAGSLSQLIASGALGTLRPDQRQFLIQTRQLAENAMNLRTILGAGQGSEDVRDAIRQTLPSLLTPDKAFALDQLDAFDATLNRLRRGIPKVPLRTDIPQNPGGAKQRAATAAGRVVVGQKVKLKNGSSVTVTAVHPDGTFDAK